MAQYFNFRDIKYTNLVNSSLVESVSDVRFKTTALIGNAISGIPFVPKTYKKFKFNSNLNDLDSFEANYGSFNENHKEFQGKILPYIAAYSVLERNNQLNFMRLLGDDLNDSNNPNLKPGFSIENNNDYNLYLLTLKIKDATLLDELKTGFNYHLLNQDRYYLGVIITKKCTINTTPNIVQIDNNKYFEIKLVSNDDSFVNNLNSYYSGDFTSFLNVEKNKNIIFSLNYDDNFYWKKTLNNEVQRLDDFGYSFLNYDDVLNNFYIQTKDIFDINQHVELQINQINNNIFKDFQQSYKYAISPWVVSQGLYSNKEIDDRSDLKNRVKKLFRIHAISPGKIGNNLRIKIRPITLKNEDGFASFDLLVIDITKSMHDPVLVFSNLNLNQHDKNFIGRRIGNIKEYFSMSERRIVKEGEYQLQNHLIRVELSDDLLNDFNYTEYLIPAGFTNNHKIKSNIINGITVQQIKNDFILQPIVSDINETSNTYNLSDYHHWGKNFYNIKNSNLMTFEKNKFGSSTGLLTSKQEIKYELINYLIEQNEILKNNNYLNSNYFSNQDEINDDMFHLEKIILLNSYNSISNIFMQEWKYSKYNQSILKVEDIKNNSIFFNDIFDEITTFNPYYFYTISDQKLLNYTNNSIDSIEEAFLNSGLYNILDFSFELSGGWDGLNILDINEYCINDKGLNQNQYLQELYKIAFDIITDEANCQSELIYLPEIFNINFLSYAYQKLYDNRYNLLMLDTPLKNDSNQNIYSFDFLKQASDNNNHKWKDFYFEYKKDNLPIINWDNTILNIESLTNISHISSFTNYIVCQLNKNTSLNNNTLNNNILNYFVLPAGLFALYILNHYESNNINKMNPLYNNEISNLGDFNILFTVDDILNTNQLIHNIDKDKFEKINKLCSNFICNDIMNEKSIYRFMSDKTNSFEGGQNLITSSLNVRNTLNDIKRKIKLLSYLFLFENVDNRVNFTKRMNAIYTLYLNDIKRIKLIDDFKINLDEKTTSLEDISNNLIRGSIFLKFKSTRDMIKIDI